jgi:capsular exopolysaccharide synthesis family protein
MLAEAYRSVRTGLQFSTAHGAPHRLVLTSASNGEGKSTTALALAINFAQMGKAVLLIDADLRHPSIHRLLGLQNDYGLSNYLSSDVSDSEVTVETSIPNLYVMTSGPMPPNPVELLSGMRFLSLMTDAGERFAHIIVDAPPVLGISDAIVLCNQVDNAVFVIESGRTRKAHIKAALKRLRHAGVHPLGVILTKVTSFGEIFGYANGYYAYGRRPATTTSPGRAV